MTKDDVVSAFSPLGSRSFGCGCCHVRESLAAAHGRRAGESARGGAARAAAGAREPAANTGVSGYSPPPSPVSPIRGLIDFHTHAAPDVFGRAVDDDELASLAAARQMEAVVFKNHVALTADRAWLARKHVPGIKIFGGIVLNGAAGAINPRLLNGCGGCRAVMAASCGSRRSTPTIT